MKCYAGLTQDVTVGVGDMAKISYHGFIEISRFHHGSFHVGFNNLSEQYSQTNFPIINKAVQGNKI